MVRLFCGLIRMNLNLDLFEKKKEGEEEEKEEKRVQGGCLVCFD